MTGVFERRAARLPLAAWGVVAMLSALALACAALPACGQSGAAQTGIQAGTQTASSPSNWRMVGPFGGNARALAYDPSDPDHILAGTGAGALFDSTDNGLHWRPFAQLGPDHDLTLQALAFDPAHPGTIYAGGWSITGSGGGFFLTRDGGRSWSEPAALRGKSIQALALSPSDPQMLVAGRARRALPQSGRRRELGADHARGRSRPEELRVRGHRSARSADHLRGNLAPALEDDRRRPALEHRPQRGHRRFRCLFHRSRPRPSGDGLRQRVLGNLPQRRRRSAVSQGAGNPR